jgi:hypothetical protein
LHDVLRVCLLSESLGSLVAVPGAVLLLVAEQAEVQKSTFTALALLMPVKPPCVAPWNPWIMTLYTLYTL